MQYETEEQQVEALKEWWRENGRAVILGVVIGVGAIGGWTLFKKYQESNAIAASDLFSQGLEAIQNGENQKLAALADTITDEHDDSLYAAYTSLAAARAAVELGNLDEAERRLQWVVDNANLADVGLVARVRLARVKGAQGDAAGGLTVLPSTYAKGFTGIVEETRGDLHVAAGDNDAARTAYQAALDSGEGIANQNALQMKLNELAEPAGEG